jgi:polar amino acid transport system permease protein
VIEAAWLAPLARGLLITVLVFLGSASVAVVAGLVVGIAATHGGTAVRALCRTWVEVLRGTSALVQLFWVVFALPLVGIHVDPLLGGMLVLGLNSGAYAAEVVRGALRAVPRPQLDAAAVLGLSFWQRLTRVELPQALPVVLPTAGNLAIELLKNTSLVSLIGLADLTFQGTVLRTSTLADVPILCLLLIAYLGLALVVAHLGHRAERSCARWHRGMAS